MKITTSFTPAPPSLLLSMILFLWGIAAVFAITGLWFGIEGTSIRQSLPQLEKRLSNLKTLQKNDSIKYNAPSHEELLQLKARIDKLKKISGSFGQSSVDLLYTLESILPGPAYLLSINNKRQTGKTVIVAEAPDAEVLTRFLDRLEKTPQFKEVLLAKQTQRKSRGRPSVQYEIHIREQGK